MPYGPGRKLVSAADRGAVWSADVSPDGREVLLAEGGLDDERHDTISTIPFEGGARHVLILDGTQASWAGGIPSSRDDGD